MIEFMMLLFFVFIIGLGVTECVKKGHHDDAMLQCMKANRTPAECKEALK